MLLAKNTNYIKADTKDGNYTGAETTKQFEGVGYDTPEEAISAYTQALKNKDLDEIILTFAVETYVDHYDVVKSIERMQNTWTNNLSLGLDGGVYISGTMQRELSIYERVGSIVEAVQYQHARLSNSLVWYGVGQMKTYKAGDDEIGDTAEEMAAAIYPAETDRMYDEMQLGEILTFSQICSIAKEMTARDFGSEANLENIIRQHRQLNMEDFQIVAQVLSIGDQRFVLTGGAVKYNGKWYMSEVGGAFSDFINASRYSAGMIPVGDTEYSEYFKYIPDEALDSALAEN